MLAALCLKVDVTSEDGYNRGIFDGLLAAIQFAAPAILVFQMFLSGGNVDADNEGAGAVGASLKLVRSVLDARDSVSKAKEEFGTELEMVVKVGNKVGKKMKESRNPVIPVAGSTAITLSADGREEHF